MNEYKDCTKEELDQFVKDYPRPLEVDVYGAGDPPIKSYNDFSSGKVWPESVVARVIMGSVFGDEDEHHLRVGVDQETGP